jgi:hypothetical protein
MPLRKIRARQEASRALPEKSGGSGGDLERG